MNKNIEELKARLEELKNKKIEKKITGPERLELKKIEKKIDEAENPVEPSGIFIPDGIRKKETVKISSIISSGYNDRTNINEKKLTDLKDSISEVGLLQRINVIDMEDGTYKRVNGKRRILAYKDLNKEEIEANIWKKGTDPHTIRLAILHENTVREDLSVYDKVRLTYDFLKEVLNLDTNDEIKTLLTKIKNKNKLKKIDPQLFEKENSINKTLKEIKIFGSISRLLNVSPVLKMSEKIINYINVYSLDFPMAKKLSEYENKNFKNIEFDTLVKRIANEEMNLNEAISLIESHLEKEEVKSSKKDFLNIQINNIKKSAKKLKENEKKDLEKDLENIYKKYFL